VEEGPVRIEREGGRVTVRDRPAAHWLLGAFLLAGGILAMAAPLGLATGTATLTVWERLTSFAAGVVVGAGAMWWLRRSPGTRVELDLTRRRMQVLRFGVSGRQVRELAFGECADVDLQAGEDSEGGLVVRPLVRLKDGESVLLSELWSHDRQSAEEAARAVAEACGLPRPRFLGAPAPDAA
jgi:hypothetical protein